MTKPHPNTRIRLHPKPRLGLFYVFPLWSDFFSRLIRAVFFPGPSICPPDNQSTMDRHHMPTVALFFLRITEWSAVYVLFMSPHLLPHPVRPAALTMSLPKFLKFSATFFSTFSKTSRSNHFYLFNFLYRYLHVGLIFTFSFRGTRIVCFVQLCFS